MPQDDTEHRLGSQDDLEDPRNFKLAEAKMRVALDRVEHGTATAADYETLKPWEALAGYLIEVLVAHLERTQQPIPDWLLHS